MAMPRDAPSIIRLNAMTAAEMKFKGIAKASSGNVPLNRAVRGVCESQPCQCLDFNSVRHNELRQAMY
jgi:hypothetical protein